MPNNRRKARNKRPPRRKNRQTQFNQRGTVKRNPYRGLILTGVRSLITALPGSTILTPLVDFLFSSVGLTDQVFGKSSAKYETDDIAIYGLTGAAFVNYINILARHPNAALDTTKGPRNIINTPFSDARLIELVITAQPDNKAASRSGRWTMLFMPYRNIGDHKEITGDYIALPQARIQTMAGSVTNAADRPLQIRFRPRPSDGFISQFNPVSDTFGAIVIAYSEPVRDAFHDFKAEDFATNITMKGTVEVRQPHFKDAVIGYEDKTWTPAIAATVYSTKSKAFFSYGTETYTCNKSTYKSGTCKMTGLKYSVSGIADEAEDMQFEELSLEK